MVICQSAAKHTKHHTHRSTLNACFVSFLDTSIVTASLPPEPHALLGEVHGNTFFPQFHGLCIRSWAGAKISSRSWQVKRLCLYSSWAQADPLHLRGDSPGQTHRELSGVSQSSWPPAVSKKKYPLCCSTVRLCWGSGACKQHGSLLAASMEVLGPRW